MDLERCVAIKYEDNDVAPKIVAKGELLQSKKIIDLANENGVKIIKNDTLLETLFLFDIEEYIPEETYMAVAKILAFIGKKVDEK